MSLPLVLILMALGIHISHIIVDTRQVTLHWLRLGHLISLPLLAVAGIVLWRDGGSLQSLQVALWLLVALLTTASIINVTLVHLGRREGQRIVAAVLAAAAAGIVFAGFLQLSDQVGPPLDTTRMAAASSEVLLRIAAAASVLLSGWLIGGVLITMLLGHAYLTSGSEMTQAPFLRLTRVLFVALAAQLILTLLAGAWPAWIAWAASPHGSNAVAASASSATTALATNVWTLTVQMMLVARYIVGFFVPLVMLWMADACIRIRSNQSATGILYVTFIVVVIGELSGLALMSSTGFVF